MKKLLVELKTKIETIKEKEDWKNSQIKKLE